VTLIDTVQLQETSSSLIELFDITLPGGTGPTIFLCNGLNDGENNIYFSDPTGTTLNEYIAIPIDLTGIELSAAGASARPSLSLVNIISLGRTISKDTDSETSGSQDADEATFNDLLIDADFSSNEDFLGSRITYRTTLESHVKSAGDSAGLPVEFPSQTFIVERISQENNLMVTFELVSPFDVEGQKVPGRVAIGQYCSWEYQGLKRGKGGGCYWPLDSLGRFFDDENNPIAAPSAWSNSATYSIGDKVKFTYTINSTNDSVNIFEAIAAVPANKPPVTNNQFTNLRYWKRIDLCGKLLSSCKQRFQGTGAYDSSLNEADLDERYALPFGAFPGLLKFR
tara:strand:- start:1114 stop:2133 length:1020 start_codon:yes stop_codon:yes gene_type:complete